ncbi:MULTISPECIES: alpha/beta hydrolase [Kocuria]|uniref:alpha/beta hydrolase n=1 Tax=Kocuria TaxID=57493 RepID=UPI0034CDCC98
MNAPENPSPTTTFALIPPAASTPWYWHLVADELRERGHGVITVDLPCADDSAGLEAYADIAAQTIGDARDVVIVAQSLGAYTGTLIADRVNAQLLILLTPMIPLPGESPGDWWENTGYAQARQEQAARLGWAPEQDDDPQNVFFHELSDHMVEEVTAHAVGQSGHPFQDPLPLETWPNTPTRVLICRDDRFFPVDFLRKLTRERLQIDPDEMGGGHPVALSRPVELADKLEGIWRK